MIKTPYDQDMEDHSMEDCLLSETDDSALKSRLLESLVDAYHTPELASWHTPVSALHLKAVKNQFLEGVVTPVGFLEELQNLLTNPL